MISTQGERPAWFPDWRDETAVIVAGGPSAATENLERAKGRAKFLTVNDSWRLAPWADALYSYNEMWWRLHKGVPAFEGLKISQDGYERRLVKLLAELKGLGLLAASESDRPRVTAASLETEFEEIIQWGLDRIEWGLKLVTGNTHFDQIMLNPGEIGCGGHNGCGGTGGGFQALNLAIQFGSKRIVLVGYDMRIDRGVCWHGKYGQGLSNKTETDVIRWRKKLDAQSPMLKEIGVEVLNASPVSTLEAYPKVEFSAALCS